MGHQESVLRPAGTNGQGILIVMGLEVLNGPFSSESSTFQSAASQSSWQETAYAAGLRAQRQRRSPVAPKASAARAAKASVEGSGAAPVSPAAIGLPLVS